MVALDMVVTMIASDLFSGTERLRYAQPEMDALTTPDALLEAALVSVTYDALSSGVGLLFDLRGAVHFRGATTAAIIFRRVRQLDWLIQHDKDGPVWHAVMGSFPSDRDGKFSLLLTFTPDAELRVDARAAEFYVGNTPGLGEAPPDFLNDDTQNIIAGMPSWQRDIELSAATFVGSLPE